MKGIEKYQIAESLQRIEVAATDQVLGGFKRAADRVKITKPNVKKGEKYEENGRSDNNYDSVLLNHNGFLCAEGKGTIY